MACVGRGDATGGHCCWLAGKVCDFLVDSGVPGEARFRCGLMLELGDWDLVHDDPRYAPIRHHFTVDPGGEGLCGDWQPVAGQCCLEVR
jgi:hypothetical protein